LTTHSSSWARQLNAHLPWLLMLVLIFLQSSLTSEILSIKIPKGIDKLIHFSIFGLLGWLMTRGVYMSTSQYIKNNFLWLVPLFCLLYAISDEFHQALVPGRSPDIFDIIADIAGVVFFMLLYKKKES
jgi:VanZ family protein